MAESTTPIYGFPQWQPGDRGWGDSINQAFLALESLINGLTTSLAAETARAENSELQGPQGGWSFNQVDSAFQTVIEDLRNPLTWGDVVDMATWADVKNDNTTWAVAVNHTWGELVAVKTWQYVINSGKTWANAASYTWETL